MKVAIIGGGASGLYLAYLLASSSPEYKIVIFEKNERCGKKILMTGNGRGNLSNLNIENYHYNNEVGYEIVNDYPPKKLQEELSKIGLETYADSEGRVYPYSEAANSILDTLRLKNTSLGVKEITNHEIVNIDVIKSGIVLNNNYKDTFDQVIIACGTGAGFQKTITKSKLDQSLEKLGFKYREYYPSLTPLYTKEKLASLAGIRVKAKASIYINEKLLFENEGEVLFRQDGLSGILIFELSSFYARMQVEKKVKTAKVVLDLFSNKNEEELKTTLFNRQQNLKDNKYQEFFVGLFPKAVGNYILKESKIDFNKEVVNLNEKDIMNIMSLCKSLTFNIETQKVSLQSQVYSGGLTLKNLSLQSLESLNYPNLYFMGEYIDVDGLCGGYNLQFAFSSAYRVFGSISEKLKVSINK